MDQALGIINETKKNPKVYKAIVKMNFLTPFIDSSITFPCMFPVFSLLYSSTNGSIISIHFDGKKDKNMMTEYPCGKCGDSSNETNVW